MEKSSGISFPVNSPAISFCIVNLNQRELLERCLDAIASERAALPFETEVLVLDCASSDGSVELAREHSTVDRLIALDRRTGKAENDSRLLREMAGEYGLLLNGDSELLPGSTLKLYEALQRDGSAGAAGAALLDPDRVQQPSAWRFPTVTTALLGALWFPRRRIVQSTGEETKRVDWAQSAALLVRKTAAAAVNYLDPAFFIYSDEVDFCKRLSDQGWHTLYVPSARAIHHEQLSTGDIPQRRIVEFSRNRDLYMRKHHGRAAAYLVRLLTAWTYLLRTLGALLRPDHSPHRYLRHVTATLFPTRGEGVREAAEQWNAQNVGSS